VLSAWRWASFDSFNRFRRRWALAFQVVDDILDFTGVNQQLGKTGRQRTWPPATSNRPALLWPRERPALTGPDEREFW